MAPATFDSKKNGQWIMSKTSIVCLREHFDAVNGGISVWLPHFADSLVINGLDEFHRFALNESKHSPQMALRNDWHFLRVGIEGLENEQLKSMIVSLEEPMAMIRRIDEEYRCCVESIKEAEEQWRIVAAQATKQIDVWERWAVETTFRWREHSFPWPLVSGYGELSRLQISFDLRGASAALESPQRLQENLSFFDKKISRIHATISSAYLTEGLPEESNVYSFDVALKELMKHQTQVNTLENKRAEIAGKLECARNTYFTQREPLTLLLGRLPDTAQWALFRICRPDLRDRTDVEQLETP